MIWPTCYNSNSARKMSKQGHICWGAHAEHATRHLLEVRQLAVRYKKLEALSDISFSCSCGQSIGLIGPNGAGKSSLLKAIAGLIKPSGGSIVWRGAPLAKASREIAYVPQRSEVDWSFPLTVEGLVAMGRYPSVGAWRSYTRHDHEIIAKAISALQLQDLAKRQIGALSGGQQQRAFLARAIAQEAHVILLDEPFTGLDVQASAVLSGLLQEFVAEGRLIITSHHDLHSARELFGSVLLIKKNLQAMGAPEQVLTARNLELLFG